MHTRTLKEVLSDHNITPLTDAERNVIRWKHLRASTSYPRYFIERYGNQIFITWVVSLLIGLGLLLAAGAATIFDHQMATVAATAGYSSLGLSAAVFVTTTVVDEYSHERPAYWSQRLDHTCERDQKYIPADVKEHINALTHPMGSGAEVSVEGSSTRFSDAILVHYVCWVEKSNPLEIEAIASWETRYKPPDELAT